MSQKIVLYVKAKKRIKFKTSANVIYMEINVRYT